MQRNWFEGSPQSRPSRIEPDRLNPDSTFVPFHSIADDDHPLSYKRAAGAERAEERIRHQELDHFAGLGDELVPETR